MSTRFFMLFLLYGCFSEAASARVSSSFTESFSSGAYTYHSWTPVNAGSSLSLQPSSIDRDQLDDANDGGLLIERGGGSTGTYGGTVALGTVVASDVGATISIDFAYEQPDDPFSNIKPVFAVAGTTVAEGATFSLFASGADPGAANGLYSSVMSKLSYTITSEDVGKDLSLTIQYYDGNTSQNRDLILDAVNFTNTADTIAAPAVSVAPSVHQSNPALDVTYERLISQLRHPIQYWEEYSEDLSEWSWTIRDPQATLTSSINSDYQQVTKRFSNADDTKGFYRLRFQPKQVGDPGVTFDASKYDSDYPQMLVWQTAGVQGGIPFPTSSPVLLVLDPTDSAGINAAINQVASEASLQGGGRIILKDGTYTIDAQIVMKDDVRLVGESRDGVELSITMQTATDPQQFLSAIYFDTIDNAGLENLTIRGAYGTPDPAVMDNVKPEFMVVSVSFNYATNCWVDRVNIIDSGNHALSGWRANHITIRNCYIDGAWNKGGGGRGYLQIQGDRFLITGNRIRNLRHFVLQNEHCEYNVVYQNHIEQDVNFHNDDNGNNLVEANRIILPSFLGSSWHSVMGPWSTQHTISRQDNFVFNNHCIEYNNNGTQSYSGSDTLYLGARNQEQAGNVFATSSNLPKAGTFYPVIITPDSGD